MNSSICTSRIIVMQAMSIFIGKRSSMGLLENGYKLAGKSNCNKKLLRLSVHLFCLHVAWRKGNYSRKGLIKGMILGKYWYFHIANMAQCMVIICHVQYLFIQQDGSEWWVWMSWSGSHACQLFD